VRAGGMLWARSIKPFAGGRGRLRWTRFNGYGNSIFFCLQSIDSMSLKKTEGKRESKLRASPLRQDLRSIAREASAAGRQRRVLGMFSNLAVRVLCPP